MKARDWRESGERKKRGDRDWRERVQGVRLEKGEEWREEDWKDREKSGERGSRGRDIGERERKTEEGVEREEG